MKKCPDCKKEIDKYGVACDYCGRVLEEREKKGRTSSGEEQKRKK